MRVRRSRPPLSFAGSSPWQARHLAFSNGATATRTVAPSVANFAQTKVGDTVVIVIEDRRGDTNRSMGIGPHPELSGVTMNLMRNKRSIGLDVRTPEGYEALGRLVATELMLNGAARILNLPE